MGVVSKGEYGVDKGLVFSFPVTCENGGYKVVEGVEQNEWVKDKFAKTLKELREERDAVQHLLR